eukprot:112005-Alexandrium_andersonii.AAC.1
MSAAEVRAPAAEARSATDQRKGCPSAAAESEPDAESDSEAGRRVGHPAEDAPADLEGAANDQQER